MFEDLDATLKSLLSDQRAPQELRNAEVSFQTPDKDFAPASATVSMFLYHVQENRELRVTAPIMQLAADNSQYLSRAEPLRLDCTYLVTTWSKKTGGLRVEEEHRLLGLALRWVSRFPTIPERLQSGALAPPQRYPLTTLVAQMKPDEALSHFWSALGIAPRPMFTLTVTAEMQLSDDFDTYPPVRNIDIDQFPLDDWALTGHVRDVSGDPVPGATVVVTETGSRTMTDGDGGFVFRGLAFDGYTLRVQASGHGAVPPQRVDYQPSSLSHDILLTGP